MEVKSAVKKIKPSHEVGSSERDVPWDQGAGVAGVGWYKTQDSDTFVGSRQERLAGRLTCSDRGSYSLNSAWALFSAMLQFYPFDPVIVLLTLLSRIKWGQKVMGSKCPALSLSPAPEDSWNAMMFFIVASLDLFLGCSIDLISTFPRVRVTSK